MNKQIVYWVRFYSPGSIVNNEWSIDQKNQPKPEDIEWPDNAYCFTINKRVDVIDGDKVYKGEPEQIGPIYYHPDSKVETLDEVNQNPNATDILVRNMECNDWEKIIWSRWNNWPQPFDPSKHVVM